MAVSLGHNNFFIDYNLDPSGGQSQRAVLSLFRARRDGRGKSLQTQGVRHAQKHRQSTLAGRRHH